MIEWKGSYTIRNYEVDPSGLARASALWDIMQDASINHSEETGFSHALMLEKGIFWVIAKMELTVNKYPAYGQNVAVSTFPKGSNRLYVQRDYIIKDESGDILASAKGWCAVVDVNTMRVASVRKHFGDIFVGEIEAAPEKMLINEEVMYESERRVVYNDIDVNKHMNNGRYINWLENLFLPEEYDGKRIKSVQANFLSEAKMDEVLRLVRYADGSDGRACFQYLKLDGKPVFQAAVEFMM